MSNPDLDPKVKIVAIYNKRRQLDGKLPISQADYNFSDPVPYTGPRSNHNTRIKLTPKTDAGAYGLITIYYDRIDLATITGAKVVKGSATTVTQLLAEINEELGVELTSLDVLEAPLGNGTTFTLTAAAKSLIFVGSTQIGYY